MVIITLSNIIAFDLHSSKWVKCNFQANYFKWCHILDYHFQFLWKADRFHVSKLYGEFTRKCQNPLFSCQILHTSNITKREKVEIANRCCNVLLRVLKAHISQRKQKICCNLFGIPLKNIPWLITVLKRNHAYIFFCIICSFSIVLGH